MELLWEASAWLTGLGAGKLGMWHHRQGDRRVGSFRVMPARFGPPVALLHPCRARTVLRVTMARMANQDTL